ncbi:MAG: OmpA family protein [Saprospiraceae bacterium]
MNFKALMVGLVSLLYFLGANWYYSNNHSEECCPKEIEATVAPTVIKKERDPLMFNWSNNKTLVSDTKFPGFKSNILADNKEGKILEITGRYFDGEVAPENYADMGRARAEAIWKERFPEIPATRIKFKSEKMPMRDGVKTKEFTAAGFNWIDAPTEAPKVIETANTALIYFNFNGTRGKLNQEVTDYLQKVAERLNNGTEKIKITGHTDDIGEEGSNNELGMRRARTVQSILKKYGVAPSRISISSKGEIDPVESNKTESGRALNRRAFVEIVK